MTLRNSYLTILNWNSASGVNYWNDEYFASTIEKNGDGNIIGNYIKSQVTSITKYIRVRNCQSLNISPPLTTK